MKVIEIFSSLQGEGLLVGRPSVFIRTAGCPLRCRWCDTKYALDASAAEELSIEEIVKRAADFGDNSVVVTGGEPMVQAELGELLSRLRDVFSHITVETSGVKYQAGLECDLMSISPKLSNSGLENFDPEPVKKLMEEYQYQLKFVIVDKADGDEVVSFLKYFVTYDPEKVLLMPEGSTRSQVMERSTMVADICRRLGFVFGQRLHTLLWDGQKGK